MSAYSDSWKEEALLHDGSKVTRSGTHQFGEPVLSNGHAKLQCLTDIDRRLGVQMRAKQ